MKPRIALSFLLLLVLITGMIAPAVGAQAPAKDPEAAPVKGLALDTSITGVGTDYAWSQTTGTYTEITGGTQLSTSCDDTSYNANPIPFTFTFNGTPYTQVSVNCNGFLAMGASVASSYTPISSGSTNNIVSILGRDLQTNTTGSEIRLETLGTTPNQVAVVQWKNFRRFGGSGENYNFQIRLYETSNLVEVVYGEFVKDATSATAQIGLRGASNADFNNRSGTGDWTASVAGTLNSATLTLSQTYLPPSGLTWDWTPLPPHPVFDTSYKVAPSLALVGGSIAYTVHIRNTGSGPANGASLVDPIPAGTLYNGDVACSSGTCGFDGASVWWFGTVAVGGEETVSFSVSTAGLPCGTVVPNDATLSDPGLLNGPVTKSAFTTLVYAAPFVEEGFEVSVPPPGWTETIVYDPGTDPDWSQVSAGTYPTINPHGGGFMAKFNSFNQNGGMARLATYALDLSTAADPRVSFYMSHDTGYSTNADRIQVQVSNDGGLTWVDVGAPVLRYDAAYTAPGWGLHTVDLSVYAGQPSVMVGFLGISAYGNNFYLDDVSVFAMCELVPEPDISVTPDSLSAQQCPDTQTQQTLNVCNVGGGELTWTLAEQPAPKQEALVPDGKPVVPQGSSTGSAIQPFKARIEANDILLITTTDVTSSVLQALDELGYAYDYYYDGSGDWTGLDLSPYQVVIAAMDGGGVTAASIQKVRTDVIDAGKRLVFLGGTCWSEFAVAVNDYLVGNDINNYCWQVTNPTQWTVVDPGHPLAAGLPGSYDYFNTSAGYYATRATDPALETVAINGEAWPTLFHKASFTETAGDLIWYIDSVYTSYWTAPSDFALLKQVIANSLGSAAPDIPWLSEDPVSGTLLAGECAEVTVTFDSTGLAPGLYGASLVFDSNDPDEPQVSVPVALEVLQCALYPDITVTPETLSATLCEDSTEDQTLTICNDGDADLTWSLTEAGTGLLGGTTLTLPAGPIGAPARSAVSGGYQARPAGSYTVRGRAGINASPDVMLLAADYDHDDGSPIQGLLQAYGDLGAVDLYDPRSQTPALADLQAYDVVVVWSNYAFADATAIGNVLADYVDAGGKVIDMMFGLDPSWGYQGRFRTEAYTAMTTTSYTFAIECLGAYDPGHPIMAGVTDVCEYYRATGTALTAGSTGVAWWSGGELFVAAKDDQTVVTMNAYVGYYYQWTGQMPDVLHNAILYLGAPPAVDIPWLSETPTSGTVAPGTCQDVTVTFDSTGLAAGDYFASLLIDSNDPDEPQVIVPVQLTVTDCVDTMHLGNLTGNLAMDPYGRIVARWYVQTHDDQHAALPGVTVAASIWDPIGGPYNRTRITKPSGWARFHWGRDAAGTFQLCVDNLTRAGYTYAPADNDVPNCLSLP